MPQSMFETGVAKQQLILSSSHTVFFDSLKHLFLCIKTTTHQLAVRFWALCDSANCVMYEQIKAHHFVFNHFEHFANKSSTQCSEHKH